MRPCTNEEINERKRETMDNDINIIKTTEKACFKARIIQVITLNINIRFNSTEFRDNSGGKT